MMLILTMYYPFAILFWMCLLTSHLQQTIALKPGTLPVGPPEGIWHNYCANCSNQETIGADSDSYEVLSCASGFRFDSNCQCKLLHSDCYLAPIDAQHNLPSTRSQIVQLTDKKMKICEAPYNLPIPDTICSLTPIPDCSRTPRIGKFMKVWIDEVQFIVDKVSLRSIQPVTIDEASITQPSCDKPAGTKDFCLYFPNDPSCSVLFKDAKCVRLRNKTTYFTALDAGDCMVPISSWKSMDINYFPTLVSVSKPCVNCWVHCGLKDVIVSLDDTTILAVEVCNSRDCVMKHPEGAKELFFDRDFHSLVANTRIQVKFWDNFGHLTTINQNCKVLKVCDALNCIFCWQYVMNPKCWGAGMWTTFLISSWLALLTIGLTIKLLKPILVTIKLICYHSFIIVRCLFRLIRKLTLIAIGQTSKRYTKLVATEVNESQIEMETRLIYKPTTTPSVKSSRNPESWLLVVFSLLWAAGPNPVLTESPCFAYNSYEYKSDSCTSISNTINCVEDRTFDVISPAIGVTNCFQMTGPHKEILASLKLTVTDVHYSCIKSVQYYTFDFRPVFDSDFTCPRAGRCFNDWCENVSDKTDLSWLPLTNLKGPGSQACFRGPACAGVGCFYCTESCITVRWYASPLDGHKWEVFKCSEWVPSLNVFIEYSDSQTTQKEHLSFKNGEMKKIFMKFNIRATISIDKNIPSLGKSFILDQERISILDVSPPGQPIRGTFGEIQCQTKDTLPELCSVAPDLCSCSASGTRAKCDCTSIRQEAIFSKTNLLPQTFLGVKIKPQRDSVIATLPSDGSVGFKISTNSNFQSITISGQKCSFKIQHISGCYNCHSGAQINYTCSSKYKIESPTVCNLGRTTIICDDSNDIRTTWLPAVSPLVTIECTSSCDSDSKTGMSAKLDYIGFDMISSSNHIRLNGTHIQSQASNWDWSSLGSPLSFFRGLFSSIGWVRSLFLILSVVALFLIVWFSTLKIIYPTIKSAMRRKKMA
uniref:Glycoprotein n=1 Tax=Reticulitermes chinensis phenuivirus 1 TaxID=3133476 RepID=A0AAT9JNJ4_9VIRU